MASEAENCDGGGGDVIDDGSGRSTFPRRKFIQISNVVDKGISFKDTLHLKAIEVRFGMKHTGFDK